ncbi:helix-turn-helix domain-containing protein [Amedibacillus sp. YH-ame10]
MDCLARLRQLMNQHHMTEYKLSQASGIPLSTINSLFHKGNSPTIPTLEGLCRGLDISLSDFFYEPGNNDDMEKETQFLIGNWKMLTREQKTIILDVIKMLLEA